MGNMIVIHDLIALDIDQNFPWKDTWLQNLGDLATKQRETTLEIPTLRLKYEKVLPVAGMRMLHNNVMINNNSLLDLQYRVCLETQNDGLVIKTDSPSLEWMKWGMHLLMLAAEAAFIHCAAVEKEGRGIAFASWGGVGKTALVAGFVSKLGWNLLGDDLIILNKNGCCFSFPKPMVIYPYHRLIFPDLFSFGKGPLIPGKLNRWLTKIARFIKPLLRGHPSLLQLARKHNPQSIRIKPSEVFGQDKIADKAALDLIVWIDRVDGLREPVLYQADKTLPSRIIGSTIDAYDTRCVWLTQIALGLGIVRIEKIYSAWYNTICAGISKSKQAIVYLPLDMPIDEVAYAVIALLKANNCYC